MILALSILWKWLLLFLLVLLLLLAVPKVYQRLSVSVLCALKLLYQWNYFPLDIRLWKHLLLNSKLKCWFLNWLTISLDVILIYCLIAFLRNSRILKKLLGLHGDVFFNNCSYHYVSLKWKYLKCFKITFIRIWE